MIFQISEQLLVGNGAQFCFKQRHFCSCFFTAAICTQKKTYNLTCFVKIYGIKSPKLMVCLQTQSQSFNFYPRFLKVNEFCI